MKNDVSLIKCNDYNQENVDRAVTQAINLLGGIQKFIKKGQRVALKVNLLMKSTPEKCTTTHPAVVEAVAKLVLQAGATPFIVDSAGGPFTAGYINSIYKASGLEEVAKKLNIETNQNFGSQEVECKNAKVGFKFPILDALENSDVIINLSKLKTHSFTGFTNAVKNMFGAIPGLIKVEMHGKYRDLNTFINFLYDIHEYLGNKIALNITDAIWGMEGFGPSNGEPRKIGAIIAGSNATAVDVVGASIISLNPIKTQIIQIGIERNFIDKDLSINVLGEKLETMIIKDFKTVVPNNFKPYANYVPRFLQTTVHRLMTKRPYINKNKCKGCKKCFEHCPVKAITMVKHKNSPTLKAQIDYTKCIRCYCCQELCPFGIVKVKSGLIYKLVHHKETKSTKLKKD